jgi:hypothetical protein
VDPQFDCWTNQVLWWWMIVALASQVRTSVTLPQSFQGRSFPIFSFPLGDVVPAQCGIPFSSWLQVYLFPPYIVHIEYRYSVNVHLYKIVIASFISSPLTLLAFPPFHLSTPCAQGGKSKLKIILCRPANQPKSKPSNYGVALWRSAWFPSFD